MFLSYWYRIFTVKDLFTRVYKISGLSNIALSMLSPKTAKYTLASFPFLAA